MWRSSFINDGFKTNYHVHAQRNKPELITATLKELASKYTHANFKAGVSKEGVV
jgi:hypothetical protein